MAEVAQRKPRYRDAERASLPSRKRLQRKKLHSDDGGSIKKRQRTDLPTFVANTSTSTPTNYAGHNTSFVTMATSPTVTTATTTVSSPMCLSQLGRRLSDSALCNARSSPEQRVGPEYSCASPGPVSTLPLLLMPKHDPGSDEEMIADSPDSGFESATFGNGSLVDFDESSSKSDSFDELKGSISRTPSVNFDLNENRLCLVPPPKVEPTPTKKVQKHICRWEECLQQFQTSRDLHSHLTSHHVTSDITSFCCLWSECKVYNKTTRNLSCLEQHIRIHTGVKRFQCWLEGCDASFSSQHGLARHVPSHFSEFNLPKAKLPSHGERRFLVKRRRIKDKKKALANVHDFMDQRTVDVLLTSLVRREQMTSLKDSSQTLCKRRDRDGSLWHLGGPKLTWKAQADLGEDGPQIFFASPVPRSRKQKRKI